MLQRVENFLVVLNWTENITTVETNKWLQKNVQKTVTIWGFFEFNSVFSWQFSKISQKIAKRNDLWCNDLWVLTVIYNAFQTQKTWFLDM